MTGAFDQKGIKEEAKKLFPYLFWVWIYGKSVFFWNDLKLNGIYVDTTGYLASIIYGFYMDSCSSRGCGDCCFFFNSNSLKKKRMN